VIDVASRTSLPTAAHRSMQRPDTLAKRVSGPTCRSILPCLSDILFGATYIVIIVARIEEIDMSLQRHFQLLGWMVKQLQNFDNTAKKHETNIICQHSESIKNQHYMDYEGGDHLMADQDCACGSLAVTLAHVCGLSL